MAADDDAIRIDLLAAHPFAVEAEPHLPSAVDVTHRSRADRDLLRSLPIVPFRVVATDVPPRDLDGNVLLVPAALADDLRTAVATAPRAAFTLVQLVRATRHSAVPDALAMESIAYAALQAGSEFRTWLAARPARRTPADSDRARVRVTESATTVSMLLDRPERANALDHLARHELVEILTALAASDARIELRGAGPNFCAGGDLDEFGQALDPVVAHIRRTAQRLPGSVADLADRLTVRMHGASIGAGIELAAFAAHVVAAPDTRIRLPEIAMGLIPGCGGTVSLPRRLGANRALVLMLSGTPLTAEAARRWGLVDEVGA